MAENKKSFIQDSVPKIMSTFFLTGTEVKFVNTVYLFKKINSIEAYYPLSRFAQLVA